MSKNKRLAELQKKLAAHRQEARDLAEATDVPVEELQKKGDAIAEAIAQLEAEIEAIKKLLDVAEEVEEASEDAESVVEDVVKEKEADPAAPTDDGARSRARRGGGRSGGEVRQAFRAWLLNRDYDALRVLQRAREREARAAGDPSPVTPASGATMIPTYVLDKIVSRLNKTVFIRQLANVKTIRGQTHVPVAAGAAEFDAVGPGQPYPMVEVDFDGPMLAVKKIGGIASFLLETLKLAVDEPSFNFEDEFIDVIVDGLRDAEERLFLTGAGPHAPRGLIPNTPVRLTTSAPAVTAQDVINLQETVPEHLQDGAVWVMSQGTRGYLRGLEGAGGLLWTPNLQGRPADLLGKPVYVTPYMDDIGPGKTPIWYGNLKEFVIGDRSAMEIMPMNEKYGDVGINAFRLTTFTDSAVRNDQAMGLLKVAEE